MLILDNNPVTAFLTPTLLMLILAFDIHCCRWPRRSRTAVDMETPMARRNSGHMRGERYLGNVDTMEVHDLDQENTRPNGCQIDEIIGAGNDRPFNYLEAAHREGHDNCAKCLTGSSR